MLASSITFTTILTLIPLITVAFSVLTEFTLFNNIKDEIFSYLYSNLLPSSKIVHNIEKHIQSFISNSETIGFFGTLIYIPSSIIIISQLETSLNKIWNVKNSRHLVKKVLIYYPILLIGPIFISLTYYLITLIFPYYYKLFSNLGLLYQISIFFINYIILILFITFLYKFLPNTKVKFMSALISSIIATSLFKIVQNFFVIYANSAFFYNKIYGSLSIIFIFFIYVYITWVIFFISAEIGVIYQNYKSFYKN